MSSISLQKLNDHINTISIRMNPKNKEKPNQMSNNDNLRTTPNCNGANERIVHELLLSEKSVVKNLTIKDGRFGLKIVNVTLEVLPNNEESQIKEGVIEQVVHNTKRKTKFKQESELKIKNKRISNNNNSRNSLSSSTKQALILASDNKYKQSNIQVKETKSLEKTKNIPRVNQNHKNILQQDNANIFLQQKEVIRGEILTDNVSPENCPQYAPQTHKELGTTISSLPQTVETNNTNKTNTHNKNDLVTTLLMNPHITVTLNKNKNTISYPDGQPSNTDALNVNAIARNGKMSINKTSEIISKQIIQQKRKISAKKTSVVAELKKNSSSLPTEVQMKTQNLQIKNVGSTDHNPAQINLELDNSNKTSGDNIQYPRRHCSMARMLCAYKMEKTINNIENMHANNITQSQTVQSHSNGYSDIKCTHTEKQNVEQMNTQNLGIMKTEMNETMNVDDIIDLT